MHQSGEQLLKNKKGWISIRRVLPHFNFSYSKFPLQLCSSLETNSFVTLLAVKISSLAATRGGKLGRNSTKNPMPREFLVIWSVWQLPQKVSITEIFFIWPDSVLTLTWWEVSSPQGICQKGITSHHICLKQWYNLGQARSWTKN